MRNNRIVNIMLLLIVAVLVVISIWGPEKLSDYKDKEVLNKTYSEISETAGEGFRYTLNANEKVYILSRCLSSQILPETELSALTRTNTEDTGYHNLDGTYAFVLNHKGPSGNEITDEQIYEECNNSLNVLKEMGIIPNEIKDVDSLIYDATLYSAIDVLEPRNNVAVWKLSMSNTNKGVAKDNRLMDAYIDADTGKIYEFYVRGGWLWEDIDSDYIIEKWSEYMGLTKPEPYESDNPLLETTPYFKKYVFQGTGEDKTIVTLGFYEGINELYLKIY